MARGVAWTDDTPIRVLAPGRGKTRLGRFYASPDWQDERDAEAVAWEWTAALDALADIPATTRSGLRAKADAVRVATERGTKIQRVLTLREQAEGHLWAAYKLALDIFALVGEVAS